MPPQGELDALATRLVPRRRVLLRMTPLHAQALLNLLPPPPACLAHVFVIGGAIFPPDSRVNCNRAFRAASFNHYGPPRRPSLRDIRRNGATRRLGKTIPVGSRWTTRLIAQPGDGELVLWVSAASCISRAEAAKGYLIGPISPPKIHPQPFGRRRHPTRLYRSGDLVRF